jgi:serine/threonine protein kinase
MNRTPIRQSIFLPTGKVQTTLPSEVANVGEDILYKIVADCLARSAMAADWAVDAWAGHASTWTYVRNKSIPTPCQGWKLHVSSNSVYAAEVLTAALDVLLSEPTHFKLAADMDVLRRMNRGELGLTQVGKFITVYPKNDEQAVRLAVQLDKRTFGFKGPAIPTDRQFRSESLVHFRYGDFLGREQQLATGERRPVVEDPQGNLIADLRLTHYQKPNWVQDPFGGGVERIEVPSPGTLIGNRFLIVALLAELPRGSVLLAVDIEEQRRCVIKTARKHSYADHRGKDAYDYLKLEFELLNALTDDPRVPTPYTLIDGETDLLMLVMEDFAGERVDEFVARRLSKGYPLTDEEVIRLGIAAVQIVSDLHARGISHSDIKSTNLIISPTGELMVIDFGIAQFIGESSEEKQPGTRGYRSRGLTVVQADTYALAALLYFLATGAEPARAPDEFNLLKRPILIMTPGRCRALVVLIEKFLADNESLGPAEMLRDLHNIQPMQQESATDHIVSSASTSSLTKSQGSHDLVMRLERSIASSLELRLGQRSHTSWVDSGELARDLGDGYAGAILALTETVSVTQQPATLDVLNRAAHLLAHTQGVLPGLYAGEAGVGVAILRAGQVSGDDALIVLAAERSIWVAAQRHTSPDIYVGTAGRALFHLLLWNQTGDLAALRAADAAGQVLLQSAAKSDQGWSWTIPDGFENMSGQRYLGYAHGAAGIGDILLDLFKATSNEEYLRAARGVVRFIAGQAVLLENGGANWPDTPGGTLLGTYWCHGAAGVGVFLTHALATGYFPDTEEWAYRAGLAVAAGARNLSPCQCHGLAGGIEFLLDLYRVTKAPRWLSEACSLRTLLEAFTVERDGSTLVSSERPDDFSCSYLNGYAGVASCLSRFDGKRIRPRFNSMASVGYGSVA